MSPGQLISQAAEIEANRSCYNTLLTMRIDREQLKVLATMDDPLEVVRGAWVSAQEVGQEEEFAHTRCLRSAPRRRRSRRCGWDRRGGV